MSAATIGRRSVDSNGQQDEKEKQPSEDFSNENKHAHGAARPSASGVVWVAQQEGTAHGREEHMNEPLECTC